MKAKIVARISDIASIIVAVCLLFGGFLHIGPINNSATMYTSNTYQTTSTNSKTAADLTLEQTKAEQDKELGNEVNPIGDIANNKTAKGNKDSEKNGTEREKEQHREDVADDETLFASKKKKVLNYIKSLFSLINKILEFLNNLFGFVIIIIGGGLKRKNRLSEL